MSVRAAALAIAAGALASACVVVPVTTTEYDPDCQQVRHHMELQTVQIAAFNRCDGQGCQAALVSAVAVTAVTAIVSGSIVVVGNMVFWAERRAGCTVPPQASV